MGGKKGKKEASPPKGGDSVSLNKTAKFTVLDAPGISQPKVAAAAATTSGSGSGSGSDANKAGLQGRRAFASDGPRMDDSSTTLIGGSSFQNRTATPEWLKTREDVYNQITERRAVELATKQQVPIKVTMPDGNVLEKNKEGEEYLAWKTSPYHVAATISQGLADSSVIARITYENYVDDYNLAEDGVAGDDYLAESMEVEDEKKDAKSVLWDMTRPLVGNVSKLELLKFDSDPDAKTAFWHSSAHMLGEALEHLYGCRLTIGPPLKGGFYYDSYMGSDAFKETDCKL